MQKSLRQIYSVSSFSNKNISCLNTISLGLGQNNHCEDYRKPMIVQINNVIYPNMAHTVTAHLGGSDRGRPWCGRWWEAEETRSLCGGRSASAPWSRSCGAVCCQGKKAHTWTDLHLHQLAASLSTGLILGCWTSAWAKRKFHLKYSPVASHTSAVLSRIQTRDKRLN